MCHTFAMEVKIKCLTLKHFYCCRKLRRTVMYECNKSELKGKENVILCIYGMLTGTFGRLNNYVIVTVRLLNL